MLEHLEKRIAETVNRTGRAVLSTYGSAGIQAGQFPCYYTNQRIYLLVPGTLDLLENFAADPNALVTAPLWQVCGRGQVLDLDGANVLSGFQDCYLGLWSKLVEIQPTKIHFQACGNWSYAETIDFD